MKNERQAAVFETSSVSLIIYVGLSTQAYIHQLIIHPSRPERILQVGREQTVGRRGESRTEERANRGKSINYTANLEQK